MHPDIFTPGTYLIIVLLCLTTDVPLTVRHIFDDFITKANKWAPKCPNCGRKMTLAWYEFSKGPPTENEVFGCKLVVYKV